MDKGNGVESKLNVCVGIATKGRPDQVAAMLVYLSIQTLQPFATIVCGSEPGDTELIKANASIQIIFSEAGSTRQRNHILRSIPSHTDLIVFFDDDFYPDHRWLENVANAFRDDSSLVCLTGHVIADGILGPGLTRDEAIARIAAHDPATSNWVIEGYSPYGCNMAFRCAAIDGLNFDERLVLYGWLEDRDFGTAVAQRGGRMIKLGTAFGAHLGVKRGRVSGTRFGYSQVMNPAYLLKKGTMSPANAIYQIARNVVANVVRSFYPEPYVDRRGRLIGNLIAGSDLLSFRLTPERAETL